jgi:RNA 2',3'-cyclic 3'-phosphodiesterase
MRLFVALALPEALRARLASLAGGIPKARWVAPENLHLTLRFIGEVDGPQADDVDAALALISTPAFKLTLTGMGRFGTGDKVRSLWVGVESCAALFHLHGKVEQALQRSGLSAEGRKFKPHVTVARFNGNPGAKLNEYLAHAALFRGGSFAINEFILYSSFLGRTGAVYRPEARYALGPPGI